MLSLDNLKDFDPQVWNGHIFQNLSESVLTAQDIQSLLQLASANDQHSITIIGSSLPITNVRLASRVNAPLFGDITGKQFVYRLYMWRDKLAVEVRASEGIIGISTPKNRNEVILVLQSLLGDCA
jgi:hypothetical protein